MDTTSVLRTNGLAKRYRRRWAVQDLHLHVQKGDVFGFLGPNGAGKSTTIRMLLSLVRPTRGAVELFGKPLTGNRKEILRRVGGLVERPDFYAYLTARRNLEIVAALRGDDSFHDIDRVLDLVGLLPRAADRVKTYSHGMKQRLGIAQALLGSPELVILDEPTSGLDPQGIKEVRELIQRLSRDQGITVFLSSHLLTEIEQTATSMAIINLGTLVVQGRVADLLAAGEHVVRFNASPADQALRLLSASRLTGKVQRNGEFLECTVPREQVGAVNRMLVEAGIEVRAILPRRSLEEYFLAITEGASDLAVPVSGATIREGNAG
jgi:ABC-type multidrug transport system ATPase subunit